MSTRAREASVKKMVTYYLRSLQKDDMVPCFFRRPVPFGYDASGLDYEGCIRGFYFAIETKSTEEAGNLTPRQRGTAVAIYKAGGKVFIISCEQGLAAFKRWVEQCKPT
jgi:penicillin-binding protein-related factor A (putative recombinase)